MFSGSVWKDLIIENNVCTRLTNCFSAYERVIFAETVHHETTYIILFLTWHSESTNDDKNDILNTSFSCLTHYIFLLLMTSQLITDDFTIMRQLLRDHVNSDITHENEKYHFLILASPACWFCLLAWCFHIVAVSKLVLSTFILSIATFL